MTKYDFSDWKAHCHYLGILMTPAKGKSNLEKYKIANVSFDQKWAEYEALANKETKTADKLKETFIRLTKEIDRLEPIKYAAHLSAGCKSKLNEIYTEATTGRRKHIKSKYLEKGLELEEDAITAYSNLSREFHKKNKERVENEFITGEMDFESGDVALDTKVSWDIFTFDAVRFKPIDPVYKWQLKGYGWLYKKEKGRLVYVLLNTPEHLIKMEERKIMFEMFGSEAQMQLAPDSMIDAYNEEIIELRKLHIHDDLPLERKVKTFDVEFSEQDQIEIAQKIKDCRWYLNNIENLNEEPTEIEDE